ncbi:MAG TPA: response regulator [Nitrospiraceae bacterium]|nr:response regulator [Nitrospiraceae bacterium]
MTDNASYTILNVDDDEAGRYAKTRILQRAGYRVLQAGSGTEALTILSEEALPLVLLDVQLPDISGHEVCRIIKADPGLAHTLVLQISASYVQGADRVHGLDQGADAYLVEPIEADELVAVIRALLRLHRREEDNRRLLRQQHLLYELADAVNRAGALADLYEKALDTIIKSLNADRASILLFDDEGVMRFTAWRGLSEQYRRAVEGHSPWKRETPGPRPIVVSNIEEAGIEEELRNTIRQEGIQALAFIPLAYGGDLLGKFMVYFSEPYAMSDRDLDLAQAIAGTLALGIERKVAEQALRRSERRLRLAMAASNMGAWDIELSSGAVAWDAKQRELFGLSSEQSPRSIEQFYALVHPDDVMGVKQAAQAAEKTGQFYQEFRIIMPDGAVRWLVGHGAILTDQSGLPKRMVGVNYDITNQKEAQNRLLSFAEDLEAKVQQRTEELSRSQKRLRALAAELNLAEQRERQRVATELHDYLAQLLVLSKIKLAQAKPQTMHPPVAKVVGEVQTIMDEALTYTRTLVAQLSPPVLNQFGLPTALKWLAEQMQQRDLTVDLKLETESLGLSEDQAVLLFQSVRELLMNIIKHAKTPQAYIRVTQAEGSLHIMITDEGAGFDLEAAVAASRSGRTPGFGLFSIRERMAAIGGRFELHSAIGEGTTAVLMLPLMAETETASGAPDSQSGAAAYEVGNRIQESEMKEARLSPAAARDPRSDRSPFSSGSSFPQNMKPIRVLLVDDHAMVRQGLCGLLDAYAGIQIIGEAASGEQAVALADELQLDVVLMDVNMPGMNGIEATRAIKSAKPAVVVIGLSIQNAGQVATAMKEAGASAFLNKEAAVEDLYQSILAAVASC